MTHQSTGLKSIQTSVPEPSFDCGLTVPTEKGPSVCTERLTLPALCSTITYAATSNPGTYSLEIGDRKRSEEKVGHTPTFDALTAVVSIRSHPTSSGKPWIYVVLDSIEGAGLDRLTANLDLINEYYELSGKRVPLGNPRLREVVEELKRLDYLVLTNVLMDTFDALKTLAKSYPDFRSPQNVLRGVYLLPECLKPFAQRLGYPNGIDRFSEESHLIDFLNVEFP